MMNICTPVIIQNKVVRIIKTNLLSNLTEELIEKQQKMLKLPCWI